MDTNNFEILLHSSFVRQKDYWCEKLTPDTMLTTFRRVDFADERDGQARLEKVEIRFDQSVNERLSGFSKGSDLSLYIALVTVLKILIHRYTGQRDITVMSPVSLLNVSDTTLNDVVWIRDQWQGDITFRELLLSVKESVVDAYQNQDYPSGQLLWHIFKEEGDIPQPPFTDICCILDSLHNESEFLNTNESAAFCFHKRESGVSGYILFDATRLNQGCVQRLARHFSALLEYFLVNKTSSVGDAEFLSHQEHGQLITEFNDTNVTFCDSSGTVLDMFRRQAAKHPEATAVISPGLSYEELDCRSSVFAGSLSSYGIGAGDIVAIMMPRSVEFLVSVFAVLKCGAAFLPIDISYPVERRKFMVADSGARIVVIGDGQTDQDSEWLKQTSATIVEVNRQERSGVKEAAFVGPAADDPAYVIYTSGSTGKPKGAVVEHRNLANYIAWAANLYVGDERVRFPLYTSISFDLTITSIFTPLATGNSIVLYGEEEPGLLIDRIFSGDEVDLVKCTPSHLKLIREKAGSFSGNSTIRRLIVGGESLETGLASAISLQFDNKIDIFNEYGPTETTVGCVSHLFLPGEDSGESVPIGKPAANVQIYVLNENLRPVPIGGIGEIYISGDGVARGYLNRPELTAECFLLNPFCPGKIMYKSGDLGRWLPDGKLVYLGRRDRQLKIRGVRIELGEIETLLRHHTLVKDSVVLGMENHRGLNLAAYLVPMSADARIEAQELKDFLSKRLPAYIIPSHYYIVREIPLTTNGKTDEKALRAAGTLLNPGADFVAPRNDMEQTVASIWKEVLGIEQVGIKDNFFEIGGTSLDLLKVNRLFNERFNRDIQVVTLFSYPNIDAFCSYVMKSERGNPVVLDIAGYESASRSSGRLENRKKRLIRRESE